MGFSLPEWEALQENGPGSETRFTFRGKPLDFRPFDDVH
jgi:hypothetical protein